MYDYMTHTEIHTYTHPCLATHARTWYMPVLLQMQHAACSTALTCAAAPSAHLRIIDK